jgi:hypothetical protein
MKVIIDFKNLKEPDNMAYTNTGLAPIAPLVEEIEMFADYCNPNIKNIHLELEEDKNWSLFRSEKLFQVISWYTRTYFSNSENISIEIKLDNENSN